MQSDNDNSNGNDQNNINNYNDQNDQNNNGRNDDHFINNLHHNAGNETAPSAS